MSTAGTSASASSSSSRRACRRRSPTFAEAGATRPSPTTAPIPRPTSIGSASRRPRIPRLPDGGGYRVTGLYELKADRPFGLPDNYVTHAKNFGDGRIERYNGVDAFVNASLSAGVQLRGGFSIWSQTFNDCAVAAAQPEIVDGLRCLQDPRAVLRHASGLLTTVNGLATLHRPEDRRAGRRDGPEPAVRGCQLPERRRAEPGGELDRHQRAGHSGAWAPAGRQRARRRSSTSSSQARFMATASRRLTSVCRRSCGSAGREQRWR